MPSIVTAILSSIASFLCGKARDSAAERLKDGDLADEKLRKMIVQDLTEIKSKLDHLSQRDLLSGYTFLNEGVELLNLALNKSHEDQKARKGPADEATRVVNDTASGILSAALSLPEAFQRLKISSDKRLVFSQECFKASRETATHAFNNRALSIKDRIMACKLRVAARILEIGLEDPVAATVSYLFSLEELHGLPAVQEMFSAILKRGLKSMIKKEKRLQNVMSVLSINHALFDFAAKYSSKYPNVFTWPVIELPFQQFNPIINAPEILIGHGDSLQQLNQMFIGTIKVNWPYSAVSSRNEIIILHDKKFTVINPDKDIKGKDVALTDKKGITLRKAITVDSDDNVYIIVLTFEPKSNSTRNLLFNFLLYVFDSDHQMKHKCKLDFLDENRNLHVNTIVDKNKNIVMTIKDKSIVYVLDNRGQLKHTFERDGDGLRILSISDTNDILISSHDHNAVQIYTTKGELKSTIDVPEDYQIYQMAYHYGIGKIIVMSIGEKRSTALLCFSEAGKLEHTAYFKCKSLLRTAISMNSHPSGSFAWKWNDSVTFI